MSEIINRKNTVNYLIEITQEDLDKFYDVLSHIPVTADSYCPTEMECDEILLKNLEQYLPFMLWIDQTGYETPENAINRRYLRLMLYNSILVK